MDIDDLEFVHRFVPAAPAFQPVSPARQTPALVLLHGTGGDEEDLIPFARMVAPGAALLGIRGKELEGNASRFFRRVSPGIFDETNLIFRTHELAHFLSLAIEEYSLPMKRIIALGYSNGANMAASLLLLAPEILSGAVLLRAMVPFVPAVMPDLRGKRALIESGRQDSVVPENGARRLKALISEAGADVTHHWNDAEHGLTQADILATRAWLWNE